MNYEIEENEVILYEGFSEYKSESNKALNVSFVLTSKRMIFEQEKGFFKKQKELIDIINLSDIKMFNGEVQCKQKFNELMFQTNKKNFSLFFNGLIEAKKVNTIIINAVTGTTMAKRGSEKVKGAFNLVDETLGLDTRGIAKGIIENGIKGTIINGIKKKDK